MSETGMPTNFYIYKAEFEKAKTILPKINGNAVYHDSGVFVNSSEGGTPFGPRTNRQTRAISDGANPYGGINMCTIDSVDKYWGVGICGYGGNKVSISLHKGEGIAQAAYSNADIRVESQYHTSLKHTLSVYKTELVYEISAGDYVYSTGYSAIVTNEDGSVYSHSSIILARLAPIDGTGYPTLGAISNLSGKYCTDASVVFSDTGKCLGILESSDTSSITSTEISTSFPESALAANDGIIAVSCMAGANGNARWVGYKNGIYKVYHGSEPLCGMPGESITIKGHNFRCLAYGPFYARLS